MHLAILVQNIGIQLSPEGYNLTLDELFKKWCERRDSNSHRLPYWYLKPARLPIPPLSHFKRLYQK